MTGQLFAVLLLVSGPPADVLKVSARLATDDLGVGESYEIVVDLKVADGWSVADAGMPGALLQVDVPPCAALSGEVLTEYRDLAKHEFLRAPFERMIQPGEARVGFLLNERPNTADRFAFNVLAYVNRDGGEESWLVRQRFELPIRAGAEAAATDASVSNWMGDDTLQLGDKVEPFELPKPDGTMVRLADVLGKKNVVITTYRAFW